MPISSKCCSIYYRLAVIKRGLFEIQILGVGGVLACWDVYQSKAHPRLPNISQCKVLLYLPPFGWNFNVKLWPTNSTHRFEGECGPRWLKMVPIEMLSPIFLFDFIHTLGLSCSVWPQYTTQQTDRVIGIGRLCYCIGGLINEWTNW